MSAPPRTLRIVATVALMAAALRSGDAQAAACGAWTANPAATVMTGHESAALTYTWAPVSNCDTFTFHHYLFCWNDGVYGGSPSNPATPASGTCRKFVTTRTTSTTNEFVHRSHRAFAPTIFACQNSACTQYYGDGTYGATVNGEDGSATTDSERWVLEDITGDSDASRVVTDGAANAAGVLRYGTNFTDNMKLGVWYSTSASGVEKIMHQKSAATTWSNWNNYGGWTGPTPVAEATVGSGGDFGQPTHPWVVAADDGAGGQYVRMFLQSSGDGLFPYQDWSVDSINEAGTDFDLTCTIDDVDDCNVDGETCTYLHECDWTDTSADGGAASLEVCNDETSACDYLASASHGRVVFNYIDDADHALDFGTDSPSMLFTGNMPSTGCADYTGMDDIYMADWDGSAWVTPYASSCPEFALEDYHDPGVIPLPNGEFKAYMQVAMTSFDVCYWDGSTWGDCVDVEFAFDDSTTLGSYDSTIGSCAENIDTIVWLDGSTVYEGAFMKASTGGICFTNGGIFFAEHRN